MSSRCVFLPPLTDALTVTLSVSSPQSNEALSSQLLALESEKAELAQNLSKVEAELIVRGEELERVQSSLATERVSGVKTAEALQNQLNEKVQITTRKAAANQHAACERVSNVGVCPQESREQALESQLVAARWSSLQGALEEAQQIIQDSLAQIDDPAHIGCTSSAGPSLSPRVGRSLAPPACGLTSPLCSVSLCRLPGVQVSGLFGLRGAPPSGQRGLLR